MDQLLRIKDQSAAPSTRGHIYTILISNVYGITRKTLVMGGYQQPLDDHNDAQLSVSEGDSFSDTDSLLTEYPSIGTPFHQVVCSLTVPFDMHPCPSTHSHIMCDTTNGCR